MTLEVAVAVFAHNEEANIGNVIRDLARQNVGRDVSVRTTILCNGCSDRTFEVANRIVEGLGVNSPGTFEVSNFEQGGKGRTWNRFVETLTETEAEVAVFVDGDIRIEDPDAIAKLSRVLTSNPEARAAVSRPVATFHPDAPAALRYLFERTKTEFEDGAICGQFYAAKVDAIRDIRMPDPCLVEDGFLAACIKTELFSQPDVPKKIVAAGSVQHHFEAPRSLSEFFHHSIRITLGTELNAALFTPLWGAATREERVQILERFARREGVEEALAAHERRPGGFGLSTMPTLGRLWGPLRAASWRRFPFVFAKSGYLLEVSRRAESLYRKRTFMW